MPHDKGQEIDIREWGSRHGFPMKLQEPDEIRRVTELLARDLRGPRADQSQSTQDRTLRRTEG